MFGDYNSPVAKLVAGGEAMVLVFNKLAKEGMQIPKMTYHPPTTYLPFALILLQTNIKTNNLFLTLCVSRIKS